MWVNLILKAKPLDGGLLSAGMRSVTGISTTTCPTVFVSVVLCVTVVPVERRESNKVRVFGEWKLGKLHGQATDFR